MYIAELDGFELKTKKDFMREIDRVFGFPSNFSHNWDSLTELLRDPFWVNDPAILIRIVNSNHFSGKIRVEALAVFNDVQNHFKDPNNSLDRDYTLTIEFA